MLFFSFYALFAGYGSCFPHFGPLEIILFNIGHCGLMLIIGAVTKIRIIIILTPRRTKIVEKQYTGLPPYFKLKILFDMFHLHTSSKSNHFSLWHIYAASHFYLRFAFYFTHSGPNGPTWYCTMRIAAYGRNAALASTQYAVRYTLSLWVYTELGFHPTWNPSEVRPARKAAVGGAPHTILLMCL
jgi:hypothetical protein